METSRDFAQDWERSSGFFFFRFAINDSELRARQAGSVRMHRKRADIQLPEGLLANPL
jgi:hypothetical protein